VDQIIAAVQAVPGVGVLDRHSDLDHNRTVLTFVGEPRRWKRLPMPRLPRPLS
jgi:glutamate formiminotransferase